MAILANCLLSKRPKQCNRRKPKTFYALITWRAPCAPTDRSQWGKLSGKAHLILDVHKPDNFQAGEVLVTENRSGLGTDYEKASAIVTNQGGVPAMVLLHGRFVPAIVGCSNATDVLKTGQEVTISLLKGKKFTRDYCLTKRELPWRTCPALAPKF